MLSTEKSLVSPWPTVSSLSLSTWPAPAPSKETVKGQLHLHHDAVVEPKPQWRDSFDLNFSAAATSSSDASPTFLTALDTVDSFSFDKMMNGSSVHMDSIDKLAAKLLNLSESDTQKADVKSGPNTATASLNTSKSDININIPASSSNPRSTPDIFGSEKSDDDGQNARFKTEICRNFKEKGHCLYGDLCQFAHGKEEMRNVGQHSKYKTKRCQKYWIAGYCAYGPRCNFLHYEEKDQVQPKHAARNRDPSASGGESGYTSVSPPSMSPPNIKYKLPSTPVPLDILYRPRHGSGRLAAVTRDGDFFWIDIRTQKYV